MTYFLQIWQKYSHSIFYEVAKTAPLSDDDIRAERLRIQSQAMTLNDVDEKTFTNLWNKFTFSLISGSICCSCGSNNCLGVIFAIAAGQPQLFLTPRIFNRFTW